MNTTMIALLITQALAVIGATLRAQYGFGKLVATVEAIDKRVSRLETLYDNQGGD